MYMFSLELSAEKVSHMLTYSDAEIHLPDFKTWPTEQMS